MVVVGGRQRSSTATSSRRCAASFGRHGFLAERRPAGRPAGASRRHPRISGREGRISRPFEQVNLVLGRGGRARVTTTVGSRSASSTPHSAAARRAGSSRRCASTAAWPTPSTPSPATTPTPGWSASPSAACPDRLDEVLEPWCGSSCPGSPPTASPRRSSPAARASCVGGLVLGLEDSASRMIAPRQGRARLRRRCSASTR